DLIEEIPGTSITFTGSIQSQGTSTYTYDIGNGPQPLEFVDKLFSQEISFSNISDMENRAITFTVAATDEVGGTYSNSVSFTIKRWDIESTGTVSFTYSGTPVTYKTVRAKDGNVWLQQSLGSTKVATTSTLDEDAR